MNGVLELFGVPTTRRNKDLWEKVLGESPCPYLERRCLKNRKSIASMLIGSCSVTYSRKSLPLIICPHRLLERRQVFTDCLHLLTVHEPGNELHIVPEIDMGAGSVDYFLVSV